MQLEIRHTARVKSGDYEATILFVHGSFCCAAIWERYFTPWFSAKGFACHALSLRGHGQSEGDLNWTSLSDYVDDLVWAIDAIGTPVILVGHSMGGLVVQHALAKRKVLAAILISAVPPSGVSSSAMHMSMVAPDVLWQLGLLQSMGPHAVLPNIISRALFSREIDPAVMVEIIPMFQRESNRVAAEMLTPDYPVPPSGPDTPPVLVIGGDADLLLPVAAFREVSNFFKGELKILQNAPHCLMLDGDWWEPTADTMLSWLEKKKLIAKK